MLKKVEALCVWGQLLGCCAIVIAVIILSKVDTNGNTDNRIVQFLIKHVTIQTVVEDDRWIIEYPFDESRIERYKVAVNGVKKSIDSFCTNSFPGGGTINDIVTAYREKIMNYNVADIPSIADSQNYVKDCVNNVVEFKDRVNELGIPFFYVQTPLKASIDYYNNDVLDAGGVSLAEKNYCLTSALEKRGVDLINVARDYSGYISFDHTSHWKPEDGLDCAGLIAQKLVSDYNFGIDMSFFSKECFYDYILNYPEIKNDINDKYGYNFALPCPRYDTSLKLVVAEEAEWAGRFEDTIIRNSEEWGISEGAYHNVYMVANSPINSIYNEKTSCNKRILIIGDSFAWPVASYLSLACSNVTILYNARFTGSIISYIETMEPDVVIMVYNDAQFWEVYTEDAFCLK